MGPKSNGMVTLCSVAHPSFDTTLFRRVMGDFGVYLQRFNVVAATIVERLGVTSSVFPMGVAFSYSSHTSFTPQNRILSVVIPSTPLKCCFP
jgi:hypothetical protein